MNTDREFGRQDRVVARNGGVFVRAEKLRRNLVKWAAGLSTECAQELQKDSSQ